MNIADFFRNLLNALLDGSFERMKIIKAMNTAFKDYFYSGELNRLCKASISSGDPDFSHEMSAFFFRSGFKISIENDTNLADSEVLEISKYILENKPFIKQLMTLGFDTLIIQGKNNKRGKVFSLKAYSNLKNYFLE